MQFQVTLLEVKRFFLGKVLGRFCFILILHVNTPLPKLVNNLFLSIFKRQLALCSQRSHGTKSTMLESKLRTGTFRTKKMQICLDEVALSWMSQWTACSPAWRILHHVTASCKGPIEPQKQINESQAFFTR